MVDIFEYCHSKLQTLDTEATFCPVRTPIRNLASAVLLRALADLFSNRADVFFSAQRWFWARHNSDEEGAMPLSLCCDILDISKASIRSSVRFLLKNKKEIKKKQAESYGNARALLQIMKEAQLVRGGKRIRRHNPSIYSGF